MANIHILDMKELSVQGVIHNYNSFSLTLNYSKIGDFVLSIDNRLSNSKLLVKNRIVMLEDNGLYTGVITSVNIDIDDDGNEMRTAKGKTLGHLLSYRTVNNNGTNEYDVEQGYAETVAKSYVDKNAVSSTDRKRNFDNFMIAETNELGERIKWQTKFEQLSDVIEDIAEYQSLGWSVHINLEFNVLVFDMYKGKDLSGEVIFSTSYGNLESQSYTYNEYEEKNFAYVAGEIYDLRVEIDPETGEPITRTETIINATTGEEMTIESPRERRIYNVGNNDATGFERKETFIEVNESREEYIDIPELGLRRLEELTDIENIEVRIIDNEIFTFGEDYNLGDIVSIYDEEWGVTKDLRINSITIEIDENRENQIYLTFGNVLPMLNDKIKSELKSFEPYTKK